MVGKLIKHELYSTVRVAVIPAIVMVLLAILSRIMLETSSLSLTIIILMFYVFSVMATILVGFYFGIYSFYQSLFTGNGYLTLSLPVTPDQLIWSKLISAITVMFASIIVCILSACIFFIGLSAETLEAIAEVITFIGDAMGEASIISPLLVFEIVLLGIIAVPMSFLIFYAVMSIGQLFTVKNRKGIAIGLYIGLMFAWSIFSQIAVDPILALATKVSVHLTAWLSIIFCAAVDVGCYFLVRHIIKNKVNLLA